MTQKGQATIPLAIRHKLKLQPRAKVTFVVEGDEVKLRPTKSFFDYRGWIKTEKPFDIEKMRQTVKQDLAKRYESFGR